MIVLNGKVKNNTVKCEEYRSIDMLKMCEKIVKGQLIYIYFYRNINPDSERYTHVKQKSIML